MGNNRNTLCCRRSVFNRITIQYQSILRGEKIKEDLRFEEVLGYSEPLAEYYEQVKQEFEEHLKGILTNESSNVAPLIKRGVTGGKQLRPVLCKLVSDALEGDPHLALECGVALELIHCGALIHDDWIDGDAFRRDAPALWKELGARTAVLVADMMIATGSIHGAISEATSKSLAGCIRKLSEGAIADYTDKAMYTEAVYLKRIKSKTAALYATAAELGALVSPRAELAPIMHRFGENIGIIYQITDDYHDLINSIQTRSPIGDLALGIPTLPITRLDRYPECVEAVKEFKEGKGAEKLLKYATPEMAQDTFEELLGPWIEKARTDMAEMPENNYSEILSLVPTAFAKFLLENG